MKSILLVKKLLRLVEMTSGLVNNSFSLPERQAVKMIFFAPCILSKFLGHQDFVSTRRYKISLRVLKNVALESAVNGWNIFEPL